MLESIYRLITVQKLRSLLEDFPASIQPDITEDISIHYRDYTTNVSTPKSAISFPLACFLKVLCDVSQPSRILDVGSGFSSFIFRKYQKASVKPVDVWSLDNDPLWLNRSRLFLENAQLSTQNVLEFEEFMKKPEGGFDLILHDLGDFSERKKFLLPIIELSSSKGLVILDDFHKAHYRNYVNKALHPHQHTLISLRSLTLDDFGRYSVLLANAATQFV